MRRMMAVLTLTSIGLAVAASVSAQLTSPTPGSGPVPEAGPASSAGSGQMPAPQPSLPLGPQPVTGSGPGPNDPAPAAQPVGSAIDPASLAPNGGVDGIVVRVPTCAGPGRPGEVCEMPYQAVLWVRNGSGALVGYFETDSEGRFFLMLPPGPYTVEPGVPGGATGSSSPGRLRTVGVTVVEASITPLRVEIDTGIR